MPPESPKTCIEGTAATSNQDKCSTPIEGALIAVQSGREALDRFSADGAYTLAQLKSLPSYSRYCGYAGNNKQKITPEQYLRDFFPKDQIGTVRIGNVNPNLLPNGAKRGEELKCAWYVSKVLGLDWQSGFTESAPMLFAGLVKSGGLLVPDPKDLKEGDVIFEKGTFGEGPSKDDHAITHVGIVLKKWEENGKQKILFRHHSGSVSGVMTSEIELDSSKFDKQFYAGVRNSQITAQLAALDKSKI
ncbi:MAG: hypothetical protein WCT53_03195, partial [Candidatus Gracilibacteria bacterium]